MLILRRIDPVPVDVNEAIRNILTIATNEYKCVADVVVDFGELPPVVCNAGDINQVVLNLIINAAHAIADVVGESGRRGSIQVRTWVDVDDVVISDRRRWWRDRARGRRPDLRSVLHDQGNRPWHGQGLALSRTIVVERHGGSLTFQSHPGEGTTFFVRLPLGTARVAEPTAAAAA